MLLKHLKNKRERKETGRNKVIYPNSWNKNSWLFICHLSTISRLHRRKMLTSGRKEASVSWSFWKAASRRSWSHKASAFRITLKPANSHSLGLSPEQPQQSRSCLPFCSSKVNVIAHFLMPKQCSSHQSFLSRDLSISSGIRKRPPSPGSREMAWTLGDFCICFSRWCPPHYKH